MKSNLRKAISSLAFLMFASNAYTQEFRYRPLREFTDTLSFLRANFDDQSACFKGKPLGYLLDFYRLQMPFKNSATFTTSPYIDPTGTSYTRGVWILTTDDSHVPPDTCEVLAASILVKFKPPYKQKDVEFYQSLPDDFTPEGLAYRLKDFIIEDVGVYTIDRREKY